MLTLRTDLLKNYVDKIEIKQKTLAEKAGIRETALCFILQGKRKCEAGEYANICNALGVPMTMFIKPREPV